MSNLSTPFVNLYDEQQNLNGSEGASNGAKQTSSGESAGISGQPQGNQQATAQAPQQSNRFQNLEKYMAAGKNYNQGKGLASTLVDRIGDSANKAGSDIDAIKKTFQENSAGAAGNLTELQNNANPVINGVTGASQPQQTSNPTPLRLPNGNPGPFATGSAAPTPALPSASDLTDEDVANVRKAANATYSGPTGLNDVQEFSPTLARVGDVSSKAKQAQSEEGRFNLLRSMYSRPSYTAGQQALDNLLIQGDKEALDKMGGLMSTAGALENKLSAANAEAYNQYRQGVKQAEDIRSGIKGQLSTGIGKLTGDIDARVSAANAERGYDPNKDSAWSRVNKDIDDNTLDLNSETLKLLGLGARQNLYNLNLKDYLTQANQVSKEAVATPEEYAKYLALAKLSGIDPTYLTGSTAGQANTAGNPLNFDQDRFIKDVMSRQIVVDKALADNQNNFNLNEAATNIINNQDWNNPHTAREGLWGLINSVGRNRIVENNTDLGTLMQRGESARDGRTQAAVYRNIANFIANLTKDSSNAYRTAKSEKERVINPEAAFESRNRGGGQVRPPG